MAPLQLSLRGAIDAALGNNPNVRLYKERIEAARGNVMTQLGAMLPNLSGSARQSQQTTFLGTLGLAPVRTSEFSIFDGRVNYTQNLFSLSLIQRWRSSREALKVAEFESEGAKADAMSTVGLFYMEALKAQATIKMREANQQPFTDLLAFVKRRQGGGMGTGLDTARLESQLENERQHFSIARSDFERAKLNLLNAMGLPLDISLQLTDDFRLSAERFPSVEEAIDVAIAQRPEVQAQNLRIKSTALAFSSTVGERLPALVAQGDYGFIGNRVHNTLDTYNVAVLLQIPIFDGGQREGRIREARSQLEQESIRMQGVTLQVKMDVREALVTMAGAKDQLVIAQAGLKASLLELLLARERFAVLTSNSSLEVTNALFSVSRARENAVDALFRLNASRVHLARAMGELDRIN
ncbi:TolC family protein [Nitrospira lenta]|uniref:TolC family protein n=1 Tax=Nitrospira lenta TaxID=1436998 RepID=UPI0015E8831A|nr:TolC family protein [Nitrospira lenta]